MKINRKPVGHTKILYKLTFIIWLEKKTVYTLDKSQVHCRVNRPTAAAG